MKLAPPKHAKALCYMVTVLCISKIKIIFTKLSEPLIACGIVINTLTIHNTYLLYLHSILLSRRIKNMLKSLYFLLFLMLNKNFKTQPNDTIFFPPKNSLKFFLSNNIKSLKCEIKANFCDSVI